MYKIFKILIRIAEIISIILILFILVFKDSIAFINLKPDNILVILISVICLQMVSLDLFKYEIKSYFLYKSGLKFAYNDANAYSVIFDSVKRIKKLRIYAIGSNTIQPNIYAQSHLYIDDCCVLLRKLDKTHPLYSEEYKIEINSIINRWNMMVTQGRIGKLTIREYDNVPDLYYIIFDDKFIMSDLFFFDKNDTSRQNTMNKPLIIDDSTPENKEIIKRTIHQFDNYFLYNSGD